MHERLKKIYLNHWKELLVELKIMIFKELVETGSKPFIHQSLESKSEWPNLIW